ncbi:MAG: hypothetical protein IJ343_15160, partial [Clostridia bacterium]|nr:hypothetical protein [Clostridia bacterium]
GLRRLRHPLTAVAPRKLFLWIEGRIRMQNPEGFCFQEISEILFRPDENPAAKEHCINARRRKGFPCGQI